MNNEDIFKIILENLDSMSYIKDQAIPDIPLYMDQITTFMNENLAPNKPNRDDKMLTKTMINNYTKNRLIPAPTKKKYNKEHILLLIFIYYFKNVLSFSDIESIFKPIIEKYFNHKKNDDNDLNLLDIYNETLKFEKENFIKIKQSIIDSYENSKSNFSDKNTKDKEYLCLFTFICNLGFDIYVKKQVIENVIDELNNK